MESFDKLSVMAYLMCHVEWKEELKVPSRDGSIKVLPNLIHDKGHT